MTEEFPYKSKSQSGWVEIFKSDKSDTTNMKKLPSLAPYKSKSWSEWIKRLETLKSEKRSTKKEHNNIRLLPRDDINLYGVYPKMEPRVFLVCKKCSKLTLSNRIQCHASHYHSNKSPDKQPTDKPSCSSVVKKKTSTKTKKRIALPQTVPPRPLFPKNEITDQTQLSPPFLQPSAHEFIQPAASSSRHKKSKKSSKPSKEHESDSPEKVTAAPPPPPPPPEERREEVENVVPAIVSEYKCPLFKKPADVISMSDISPPTITPTSPKSPLEITITPKEPELSTETTSTAATVARLPPVSIKPRYNSPSKADAVSIPIVLKPMSPVAVVSPLQITKLGVPVLRLTPSQPILVSLPNQSKSIKLYGAHPRPLKVPTTVMARKIGGTIMLQSQHLERQRNEINLAINCESVSLLNNSHKPAILKCRGLRLNSVKRPPSSEKLGSGQCKQVRLAPDVNGFILHANMSESAEAPQNNSSEEITLLNMK